MALTRWIFVLLFAVGATALSAQTTFTITNTNDSGTGSLREAITMANSTAGDDTIQFGTTGTISLQTALPVITENITIDGPGRTSLIIERNSGAASDFRIFETNTIGIVLNINEVTIQGGRSTQGAGILSRGPTGLYDVLIQDCIAQGANPGGTGEGGAIYHTPAIAALTLTNSLVQNCQAIGGDNAAGAGGGAYGGGIYINTGTLGLLSTTINNCDATGGDSTGSNGNGGAAAGGGIYANFATTLTDSVVSNCDVATGAANGSGGYSTCIGGGIYGQGAVTSIDTTWQNNSVTSSTDAYGGAIHFEPGSTQQLTVTRSIFTGNDVTAGGTNAQAGGAAIYSEGVFEIRETEVSTSVATAVGTGVGSAIIHATGSAFLMERATVNGNTGVGLYVINSSSASVVNSTISGNTATMHAGGITSSGATLSLSFSTITLNSGADAGGISTANSGNISATGSIIANNTGPSAATADYAVISGAIADFGGNVIGVEDGTVFTNGGTQTGTSGTPLDAMLNALADNGGLTRTHAVQTGSPAVEGGGTTGVPSTDQRNAPRNVGIADSGAYEFGATVPGGQGSAGGEGDERCGVSPNAGLPWLLLLGLIAVLSIALRRRYA